MVENCAYEFFASTKTVLPTIFVGMFVGWVIAFTVFCQSGE